MCFPHSIFTRFLGILFHECLSYKSRPIYCCFLQPCLTLFLLFLPCPWAHWFAPWLLTSATEPLLFHLLWYSKCWLLLVFSYFLFCLLELSFNFQNFMFIPTVVILKFLPSQLDSSCLWGVIPGLFFQFIVPSEVGGLGVRLARVSENGSNSNPNLTW